MTAYRLRLPYVLPSLLATLLLGADDPLPFPDMAPTVGALIGRNYYDHSRIKPHLMVERALRALEGSEVTIEARWVDGIIHVTHGAEQRQIQAPTPRTLEEAMALIEALRHEVDRTPLALDRKRDLAYAMLNGALSTLDPHTLLMAPEPARNFSEDVAGEFFGIGAYLSQDEGIISIERVMPGLPAERAGVEDGDVILAVDGERTAGLSLEQTVRRIKGPKSTAVALTLRRQGIATPLSISVIRDLVQVVTMQRWRSPAGIGYVRMDEFNANTARDLASALLDLEKAGPLSALVLDLRYNPGGLLDQAKLISDFFLPAGKEIVRIVTFEGEPQISTSSRQTILDVPMAVLTSGGSASAAEILSGCLQRNERALVFGNTTFGKGSVQTVRPLRDNSRLKLTIQEYQLPGGVSIQDVGVAPDIRLVRHTQAKDGRIDLMPLSPSREEDHEFALGNHTAYAHTTTTSLGWLAHYRTKDELKVHGISSRAFVPDQEAMVVLDLLGNAAQQSDFAQAGAAAVRAGQARRFLLDRLAEPVRERADREASLLAAALAAAPVPVTWGPATAPDSLQVAFTGPAQITAGSQTALRFTITNPSDTPAGRIYGLVEADLASPLWEDELVVGSVPARGSVEAALPFSVPPRLFTGEERFTLVLKQEGRDAPLARLPVNLAVTAQDRPHLRIDWTLTPTILKAGEPARLSMTVTNDGAGASAPLRLRVFKSDDPYVQLSETGFTVDRLAAGASATAVTIPLTIAEQVRGAPFAASDIQLQVSLSEDFGSDDDTAPRIDGRYLAALATTITIPVGQPLAPRTLLPPRLSQESITVNGATATLNIRLDDDRPHWMTVFRDEEKLELRSTPASGSLSFTVPLEPGVNNLRVVAIDHDTLGQVLPLRLWGPGEKTKARPPVTDPEAVLP